jgi:VWFA-related protein
MARHAGRFGVRVGVFVALAAGAGLGAGLPPQNPPPPTTPPAQQPLPQRPPVFRGGVDLVALDVYPRRDGRIVEGLTIQDFEVLEDGRPQSVEQIEFIQVEPATQIDELGPNVETSGLVHAADPRRRLFVTYLDQFHLRSLDARVVSAPVGHFYSSVFAKDDLFGFLTQTIPPRAMMPGRHPRAVQDALERHWPTNQRDRLEHPQDETERLLEQCYINPVSAALIVRHRMLRTMQHLTAMFEFVDQLRPARTFVLLIADDWPTPGPSASLMETIAVDQPAVTGEIPRRGGSPVERIMNSAGESPCRRAAASLAAADLQVAHRQLIDRAQAANVLIYAISPDQLAGGMGSMANGLIELAHNTDGKAIGSVQDLNRSPAWVADDTGSYYLLGYRSTNRQADGRIRQIRVRVKTSGIRVTARRTYRAPDADIVDAAVRRAAAADAVPEGVRAAVDALVATDRAADVIVTGSEWRAGEELRVTVEIPADPYRRGPWSQGADVEVTVVEGDGVKGAARARLDPGTRSAIVSVPVGGAVAPWRVTARVRAGEAVLSERAVVTRPDGRYVGEPALFRGGASVRSTFVPTAIPVFGRIERLRIEWPWLAAGPFDRREARLLTRTGQPMALPVALTDRLEGPSPALVADLALSPLAPGDYVLELTLARGAEAEQKFVAIRIAR